MPDSVGAYVALFIDWDNLQISTAADHAGASPDLRRIVQVAQSYGTVLIARAYAEWGITGERLAIYRAGVEPVYAPTFRFESDQPGQAPRGKSLADPCLVADCIDMLHLHESLTHLVLVSGDKDLIPIVRLAQLRGKKVIVIGPDLVAAVLRDMADDFVPYRSLVVQSESRTANLRAEAAEMGRRRRRRGRGGRSISSEISAPGEMDDRDDRSSMDDEYDEPAALPTPPPAPHRGDRRERRPFVDRAGIFRPSAAESPIQRVAEPIAPQPIAAPVPMPSIEPIMRIEPIARTVVSAPAPSTEPAPLVATRVPEVVVQREVPRPTQVADIPAPVATRVESVLPAPRAASRNVEDLFATITSILQERTDAGRPRLRATNMKDYLLSRVEGFNERQYGFERFRDVLAAAEKSGIISVTDVGQVQWISLPDAEGEPAPRASSPATTSVVDATARESESNAVIPAQDVPPEIPAIAAIPPARQVEQAPTLSRESVINALVELQHRARLLTPSYVESSLSKLLPDGIEGAIDAVRNAIQELISLGAVTVDEVPREVEFDGSRHRVRLVHAMDSHPLIQRAESAWQALNRTPTSLASDQGPSTSQSADSRSRDETPPALESRTFIQSGAPPSEPTPTSEMSAIDHAFANLVSAVRESIAPGKTSAGAAGVKSRLTRSLSSFSEREFGFSKFKDFLLAAERAGVVRVETSGAATRVGLPQTE